MPRTTKFGIFARPCRLIWCPVGGLVGGFGAWAVSRKTPFYFMYSTQGRTKQGNDPTETPCLDGDGVDGDVDVVDMAWLAESGCTKVH